MNGELTDLNLDHQAATAAARLCSALLGDEKQKGHVCKARRGDKDGVGVLKASDADNMITKALGVAQESGPFACGLFLLSKSGSKSEWKDLKAEEVAACYCLAAVIDLAKGQPLAGIQPAWGGELKPLEVNQRKKPIINHLVAVSGISLDRLLLVRQAWGQMLTYARYIARSQREKT